MKKNIILYKYIIYGLLGICLEVLFSGVVSIVNKDLVMEASTSIWMFFIYGLAVFLEPIHDKIRNQNIIVRGIIYTILIYYVELLTGSLIQNLIGQCPWYYPYNATLNGIITLYFAPIWFTLGLLYERVHDYLDNILTVTHKKSKE